MAENEKMDSLSRMFNTLIRTPLSQVESVIRKGNLESQPVAPVEELTDTYTKMAAENEPMTFTENIDKPQVNQEFLADAPSFMELIPKEERLDESKFQQKVVLDTDGVYRLKTFPIEENVKTNVDILKEQIGVEQGLLEKPVEDFGGVNLGIQGAKQRELDDTIADKTLTDSQLKDEEIDTVPTISQMYPRGTDLIKLFESKNKSGEPYLEAYKDPSTGIMTIGLGNTKIDGRAVKKGDKITYDKAIQLFNESLRESINELNDLKSFLPEGVKFSKGFESALISILHNSSPKKIKFIKDKKTGKQKETRGFKALKKGDLKAFSKELFDPKVGIVSAGGKVRQGLIKRRQQELQFLDPSERYDIK